MQDREINLRSKKLYLASALFCASTPLLVSIAAWYEESR